MSHLTTKTKKTRTSIGTRTNKTSTKPGSKGGNARRDALSPEERKMIAAKAAHERWAKVRKLPKETHSGILPLGDGIKCAVLSNGERVISATGLSRALGSGAKGNPTREKLALPPFLSAANIRPFIGSDLLDDLGNPIRYRGLHGGHVGVGYRAELLHKICEVLLDARTAGVLRRSQEHIAAAAELLMRGFSRVGLIALIDEATGYQAERARDELHKILKAYIAKELLPWTKKFPDEFFEQVYRLHGWQYQQGNAKRPGYVGTFINKYVYEALPDGVLSELRRKNPPVNGRRRHKHFQFLSDHTGHPHLDKQIVAITTIMKLSGDKDIFHANYKKLYSSRQKEEQKRLPIGELVDVKQSVSERVLSLLQSGHTTPTRKIAEFVYGDGKAHTMNKTRKLLKRLRSQGLVESPSPGLWEIVEN